MGEATQYHFKLTKMAYYLDSWVQKTIGGNTHETFIFLLSPSLPVIEALPHGERLDHIAIVGLEGWGTYVYRVMPDPLDQKKFRLTHESPIRQYNNIFNPLNVLDELGYVLV